MQIAAILIGALRERDPQEFKRLSRGGELDTWYKGRVRQANEIYNQLTEYAEKLPSGVVRSPWLHAAAEEEALAAVMDDLTSGRSQ
jgi:hypothetical protein